MFLRFAVEESRSENGPSLRRSVCGGSAQTTKGGALGRVGPRGGGVSGARGGDPWANEVSPGSQSRIAITTGIATTRSNAPGGCSDGASSAWSSAGCGGCDGSRPSSTGVDGAGSIGACGCACGCRCGCSWSCRWWGSADLCSGGAGVPRGWTHSGFVWLISCSHLALPERVWIRVGRRKVGTSAYSPRAGSRCRLCTWLSM